MRGEDPTRDFDVGTAAATVACVRSKRLVRVANGAAVDSHPEFDVKARSFRPGPCNLRGGSDGSGRPAAPNRCAWSPAPERSQSGLVTHFNAIHERVTIRRLARASGSSAPSRTWAASTTKL